MSKYSECCAPCGSWQDIPTFGLERDGTDKESGSEECIVYLNFEPVLKERD